MTTLTKEERERELAEFRAELAREIRKETFHNQQLLRAIQARRGGAVPTEGVDPNRIFSEGVDPSIRRAAATNLLHGTAVLPDTLAALGTMAFSPFIPEVPGEQPESVSEGLARAFKLKTVEGVSGAVGQAVEQIPGARVTREATALGAERERGALLGEDPSLARKAGVFGLEVLSDPIELAPGGLGLKSIRLATAGAVVGAALGAAGTRAAARRFLGGLDELTAATRKGIQEGLEEEVKSVPRAFNQGQEAVLRARLAGQRELAAHNQEYVAGTAKRLRALAAQMVDFPQAPQRIPKDLQPQARALEVALAEARAQRKFAPTLQTTGKQEGRPFIQRTGRATTRPLSELQSQVARDPVVGVGVGGGLPESFFAGKVEAAVIPLTEIPVTAATKRMTRELGESMDEMALRADEFGKAMQPGGDPSVRRSIPVRSGLEETVNPSGVLIKAREWQKRLANLFSGDNMLAKFTAIRRGLETRDIVVRAAKSPSAVATYNRLARQTKKSTADLIDTDLMALAEKTGNIAVGPEDTLQAVESRLSTVTDVDILRHQVTQFRKVTDDLLDDGSDLNVQIGLDEIPYRDNYIHHKWASPKVVKNWFKQMFSRRQAKGDPEFRRRFPSYFVGVKEGGLRPVSLRFSDNMVITEMEYGQSLATKRALQQMAVVNTTEDGKEAFVRLGASERVPDGYIKIDNADLRRAVEGKGPVIAAHKSVAPVIRNILAERSWTGLDQLLSFAKMNNLGISTFHHFTLAGESAPALLGPLHGLGVSAKLRGGLPGLAPSVRGGQDLAAVGDLLERARRTGRLTELPEHLVGNELAKGAWARAAKHGVTGEPLSDVHRAAWKSMADEVTGAFERLPTLQGAGELVVKFQEAINKGLWDGFHTPVKVYAFNTVLDGMLNVKRGNWRFAGPVKRWQRKVLQKLSDEEIADRVAKVVNDEFGGQLFEGYVGRFATWMTKHGKSPVEAANVLRKLMLSPDWLMSSVRMGMSPLSGAMAKDPVRFILGVRHWKNFTLGAAMYANMTNYIFTKMVEGEGKFIFNDDLRRSQFHIRTPFRDRKTGEVIYGRWGKQFQEIRPFIDAVRGLVRGEGGGLAETREILERKLNPMVAAMIHLALPPEDFPTLLQEAERRAADKGRELTDAEYVSWAMATLVKDGLMPFSFRETGVPLAPVAIAKGIDIRDAEFNMVDALEDGDSERVQGILFRLSEAENLQDDVVKQIFQRAVRRLQVRQGLIPEKSEEERNLRRRKPR